MDSFLANLNRYRNMEYRRCGKSGLKLPVVSLGLWHNWGGVDVYYNGKAMAFRAFDLGITHFDLANNYGPPPGSAEENFGKILREGLGKYRDELIISSKAGYPMWEGPYGDWGNRKSIIASCDQSLKRMGIEYVDIFYSHRFDPETPLEETMGALDHLVRTGRALYVGISSYNAEQSVEAAQILHQLGTPCLIHQPRYNMLDRWVEKELLTTLNELGVGCIAYSPLAQGMLTDKYLGGVPDDSRVANPHGALQVKDVKSEIIEKVRKLREIALKRGQTTAQMAIAWLLKEPVVTSVILGASKMKHIEDAVKCVDNLSFSKDELKKINAILKSK